MHERDLNIDLLLLLMKELIATNDRIRLVIMSATINAELFQKYFDNCPLLAVPGFMYNVNTYFIDVSIEFYGRRYPPIVRENNKLYLISLPG